MYRYVYIVDISDRTLVTVATLATTRAMMIPAVYTAQEVTRYHRKNEGRMNRFAVGVRNFSTPDALSGDVANAHMASGVTRRRAELAAKIPQNVSGRHEIESVASRRSPKTILDAAGRRNALKVGDAATTRRYFCPRDIPRIKSKNTQVLSPAPLRLPSSLRGR